jgi:hypothetical protein
MLCILLKFFDRATRAPFEKSFVTTVRSFKLWESINNIAKTGEQHAHTRVPRNDAPLILS